MVVSVVAAQVRLPHAPIEYPESDGQPMAETDRHADTLIYTDRKSNGCIGTTFVVAASAAYWGDKSPTTNGACTESISDQYTCTCSS